MTSRAVSPAPGLQKQPVLSEIPAVVAIRSTDRSASSWPSGSTSTNATVAPRSTGSHGPRTCTSGEPLAWRRSCIRSSVHAVSTCTRSCTLLMSMRSITSIPARTAGSDRKSRVPSSKPAWPGTSRWPAAATEAIAIVPPANHGRTSSARASRRAISAPTPVGYPNTL